MSDGYQRLFRGLAGPDDDQRSFVLAEIVEVLADGTVEVDVQGEAYPALVADHYAPRLGATVRVTRQVLRGATQYVVEGGFRTSNATTEPFVSRLGLVWDVTAEPPPPPAGSSGGSTTGTSTFDALAGRSWRETGGWTDGSDTAEVLQGAYSTAARYGYWRGCYFYGSTLTTALRGRTCTGITMRLRRLAPRGAVSIPAYVDLHKHPTKPATSPIFRKQPRQLGAFDNSGSDVEVLTLPTSWGQALIDGSWAGVGLYRLSTSGYGSFTEPSFEASAGRLTIAWTT